jgi:hypothetical protein
MSTARPQATEQTYQQRQSQEEKQPPWHGLPHLKVALLEKLAQTKGDQERRHCKKSQRDYSKRVVPRAKIERIPCGTLAFLEPPLAHKFYGKHQPSRDRKPNGSPNDWLKLTLRLQP